MSPNHDVAVSYLVLPLVAIAFLPHAFIFHNLSWSKYFTLKLFDHRLKCSRLLFLYALVILQSGDWSNDQFVQAFYACQSRLCILSSLEFHGNGAP